MLGELGLDFSIVLKGPKGWEIILFTVWALGSLLSLRLFLKMENSGFFSPEFKFYWSNSCLMVEVLTFFFKGDISCMARLKAILLLLIALLLVVNLTYRSSYFCVF